MPRPQFSIRTLLWLTLVVAAFLGGIGFEKERQRRIDEELLEYDLVRPIRRPAPTPVIFDPNLPAPARSPSTQP
jgi:hypothetical protein